MKKALIVLTALAAAVTGVEPAMATSAGDVAVAAASVDKGDAGVSKQRRWGRHHGWNRGRRVCTWRGYGHRRVRVCRVVRWR